jgi:hypothetical protein
MLGVAAATALPSEIFPFRKIFLPTTMPKWLGMDWGRGSGVVYTLNEAGVEAIELEMFAKEIPDLIYHSSSMYSLFRRARYPGPLNFIKDQGFRVPVRFEAVDKTSEQHISCAETANRLFGTENKENKEEIVIIPQKEFEEGMTTEQLAEFKQIDEAFANGLTIRRIQ